MSEPILVDTRPLVAAIIRTEQNHHWVRDQMARFAPPLLTCEPGLAEAAFLLQRYGEDQAAVLELVERGIVQVAFAVEDHAAALVLLLRRYRNVPMSLADACLVRMAEIHEKATVFTLDSRFRI